jgi:hypothetical protein
MEIFIFSKLYEITDKKDGKWSVMLCWTSDLSAGCT